MAPTPHLCPLGSHGDCGPLWSGIQHTCRWGPRLGWQTGAPMSSEHFRWGELPFGGTYIWGRQRGPVAASGQSRTGHSNAWPAGREGSLGQVFGLSEKGILVAAGRSEDGVMESQLLNPPGGGLCPGTTGAGVWGGSKQGFTQSKKKSYLCFGNSLGVRCRQGVN